MNGHPTILTLLLMYNFSRNEKAICTGELKIALGTSVFYFSTEGLNAKSYPYSLSEREENKIIFCQKEGSKMSCIFFVGRKGNEISFQSTEEHFYGYLRVRFEL